MIYTWEFGRTGKRRAYRQGRKHSAIIFYCATPIFIAYSNDKEALGKAMEAQCVKWESLYHPWKASLPGNRIEQTFHSTILEGEVEI